MSGSSLRHQILAMVGALLMSSIALGAALAPSQVVAAPLDTQIVTYA